MEGETNGVGGREVVKELPSICKTLAQSSFTLRYESFKGDPEDLGTSRRENYFYRYPVPVVGESKRSHLGWDRYG